MSSYTWLFVGLGNPGIEYVKTRHNVGFLTLDTLLSSQGDWKKKHTAHIHSLEIEGSKILLCKPLSYMNLSGGPVSELLAYFNIPLEHLVVFHDELELPFGTMRWKAGGGHAGHNGLRSISAQCGSDYKRFRIGIGRPQGFCSVSQFVLSPFTLDEFTTLEHTVFPAIHNTLPWLIQEQYKKIETYVSLKSDTKATS
jgi:PTH1 family peptidyl-tRNA hydrolase